MALDVGVLLTEPVAVEVAVLVECGRDGWDQPIPVGPTGKILRREITVPTTESAK